MDTETPASPPPEARLIRQAREAKGISAAKAAESTRGVVSAVYWRDVERGTGSRRGEKVSVRGSDTVIAHMARAVGLAPERLERESTRSGAAGILKEILGRAVPSAHAPGTEPGEAAEALFPGDPHRQEMWSVLDDASLAIEWKLAIVSGMALYPDDGYKRKILESAMTNPRTNKTMDAAADTLRKFDAERQRISGSGVREDRAVG